MIRLLGAAVQHALRLHRPGRRLPVQTNDIFLVSYCKSLNTWAGLLIANFMHPEHRASADNLHRLVLDPDLSTKRDFDAAPRPRFIRSGSTFDPRYRRVIYLVRDPRDVAVSQMNRRRTANSETDCSTETLIHDFLAESGAGRPLFASESGSWGENVGSWMAARHGTPGFLLVRFEDLLVDPSAQLTRMAEFAGLEPNAPRAIQAVERSSTLRPEPSHWRATLAEANVARIEEAWGDIMACVGYVLTTRDGQNTLDSSLIGLLAAGGPR